MTALFADIKGSTELMEDLDPEEARAIIDPALKLMIDAAHRYDGYVVQSTGDGIFALFGAPVAHEDHPQRALYAALRMQEEMRRYSSKLREAGNLPVEARVGANTGEVVVRSITTGAGQTEYTPIGHTANLASRMQALAPTGSIAISERTRGLIEGYFVLRPLGPTRVKGVSGPVNVYEVTGLGPLRTRLQRAAGRGLTKFVGRERELDTLRHAAERAKAGHGQIVAAMAEAGTGKSRLYFEFKAKNQSGWTVLETFSVSHGTASAYLPVIDLLHTYFRIAGEDDQRVRREKVAGRLSILDPSLEDTRPYLFALLGIVEGEHPLAQMDGQIRKRRTLEAIKRILLRESLNQPLIVEFEDLHWIDSETQALLDLLADSIGTAKILLLVNYRPEYSHQWNSKPYYTQVRLDPLGEESADEMLAALLGIDSQLAAFKQLITEKTEGNPFFMEETVQVLFDEGALVRDGNAVKLTRSLNTLKIPPTVQGMLASRIDRLPADAKDLLQTLAVIGRESPQSLIRAVVTKSDDELDRLLDDLQLGEFIYEQPAVGDIEYAFKHALTQEVSYNSILIKRRKLLHERAGVALESMFAEQLDDHLGELAHHYSRSDNVVKAVEYLGRAGQRALQHSAYADAIQRLTAAIELLHRLPDNPARIHTELRLQLAIGPALVAVEGMAAPGTERTYTRARELCDQLGDPPELFPALFGLWIMYLLRGQLRKAYDLAEHLLRLAQSTFDPALLLLAESALGQTWFTVGEFPRAREHLEMATSLYDHERHRLLAYRYGGDAGVIALSYGAWTLWHLGFPDKALNRANESLALAQMLSHPFSVAFAEYFVGFLHQYRREARAADETAQVLMALATEHGLTDWMAWATTLRGWAMADQGRNEEGVARIREGLAASRTVGAELNRPYFLTLLAEAHAEAARFDEALIALTDALTAANENEDLHHLAEIHRLKGELLLRQAPANPTEAQRCFQGSIKISRHQSAKSFELRATTSLARLLDTQGRREEARTMLAAIYNWFTEGFDTADLKDAKALLDRLSA